MSKLKSQAGRQIGREGGVITWMYSQHVSRSLESTSVIGWRPGWIINVEDTKCIRGKGGLKLMRPWHQDWNEYWDSLSCPALIVCAPSSTSSLDSFTIITACSSGRLNSFWHRSPSWKPWRLRRCFVSTWLHVETDCEGYQRLHRSSSHI